MKLKNLNFQRNGVGGESFYSVFADKCDNETKGNFLITFDLVDESNIVDSATCRCIELDRPMLAWRGDRIADNLTRAFEKLLAKHKEKSIYDLKGTV